MAGFAWMDAYKMNEVEPVFNNTKNHPHPITLFSNYRVISYKVLARKRQLPRWAYLQNSHIDKLNASHLQKENSCFSVIARLALDAFLSSTPKKQEFSC